MVLDTEKTAMERAERLMPLSQERINELAKMRRDGNKPRDSRDGLQPGGLYRVGHRHRDYRRGRDPDYAYG